jgi:hypothetical protein
VSDQVDLEAVVTLLSPHATDAIVDKSELTELRSAANRLSGSAQPRLLAGDEVIELPHEVAEALRDLLERFANGESVVIGSTRTLLTTSQVADFLGL